MGFLTPKGKKETADDYINRHQLQDLEGQEVIRKIAGQMAASGLTKDTISNNTNVNVEVQVLYLDTLVEQNWMILKQLEKLNNK